ncbi:aspartyl protease family protein [Pedobacter psychroterrae]|uniref:PDZ domain-containing protein n=1 Tax=Pedobacter psychroterrae TaxID=2530453 RepID=A0A4R0NPZ0_9SPHI|nr:aspartyl protease family protein [Pedobacter psychroterrae]TCD03041.1 PDZ domain-containing protein [Pedobacter psychroterrae]
MRCLNLFLPKLLLMVAVIHLVDAAAANAQQFSFAGKRQKDAINFTMVRNLVIVPLYINGKGPFNFILDTGVGPMIITDTTLVKSLDLKNLRPIKINGLGKGVEIDAFLSGDIAAKIGRATISNMPAAILKEDIFGLSSYVGTRIYGLLGHSFFNSFIVELKYANKRLLFNLPGTKKKIRGEKIPVQIINSKPYINIDIETAELGKVTAKMVVDNGASHAISLETYEEKPFPAPSNAIQANLGVGLSGPISGSIGRIPLVHLGSFTMKDVITSYPIYSDVAAKTYLRGRNGNLGADILSRFNIIFDYAGEAMYVRQNQYYKRPFEHDMSGIEFFMEEIDKKRFFISRIEANSPAEQSGLMPEDEILTINFVRTSKLSLNDITRIFRSEDGKPVFISVYRNGSVLIRLIKLKKRI